MTARDLARLSPEREAEAVEAMAGHIRYGYVVEAQRVEAGAILAALRSAGFIVLHEDDVHVERCQHESTVGAPPIARLVTAWQERQR